MTKVTHFWGTKAITTRKNNLQMPLDYLLILSYGGMKKTAIPRRPIDKTGCHWTMMTFKMKIRILEKHGPTPKSFMTSHFVMVWQMWWVVIFVKEMFWCLVRSSTHLSNSNDLLLSNNQHVIGGELLRVKARLLCSDSTEKLLVWIWTTHWDLP